MKIKKDTALKTVKNVDEYELATENAVAKVILDAKGETYSETGNNLAQVIYDLIYPISDRLYFQSVQPQVPTNVTATWQKVEVDKKRYISFGGTDWMSTNEAEGKTEEHVLTTEEMPNHKHNITIFSHSHYSENSLPVAGGTKTFRTASGALRINVRASGSRTYYTTTEKTGITIEEKGGDEGHDHELAEVELDGINLIAWVRVA